MNTDVVRFVNVTDGTSKYLKYESKSENRTVEYYSDQTEMVYIAISDSGTVYYTERLNDTDLTYSNPLEILYDNLNQFTFEPILSEGSDNIYKTIKTEQIVDQEQIHYTKYEIKMTWLDDKVYEYSYYEYVDGSTLISAEAPTEINDRLNKNTKWAIDIDNQFVVNTDTKEIYEFEITNTSSGKAVSPDGNFTTTTEKETSICIYMDSENERIEKIIYAGEDNIDNMEISIIEEPNINKPVITSDMTKMNNEEQWMCTMLFNMLEEMVIK